MAFVVLFQSAWLFASVPCTLPLGIERLSNGNTVITDAGTNGQSDARIIEVDSTGKLVWAYLRADIGWAHTARRLANGNTLITVTDSNRVVEINPAGDVVWEMTSGLSYPNEAYRLANGHTLITDRDNNRVIEVDSGRNIVWSYTQLEGGHNGNRLANGNTLICSSDANKVIEVTPGGSIAWQYTTGLFWPRSCQRLPNGHTLITDTFHDRIIEVDSAGNIVWSLSSGVSNPFEAIRLANGNTVVSTGKSVIEVDSAKNEVWRYPPPASAIVAETLRVVNPTSGCSLYVHIHRPAGSGPAVFVPGVVLVPDSTDAGTVFDDNGLADSLASDGFAVLHFDADGRGRSGQGTIEDYDGPTQQDGLAACADTLAKRPYVRPLDLGIYSRGYGITMATGMIARHLSPQVKFLVDFEGPADRFQSSSEFGGPVPYPPDSDAFWQQREAARFIKSVPGAYLRIQHVTDHTGRINDNRHAIALIDSATATLYGGSGISSWTRVNDSLMNSPNRVYSLSDPPVWIPDAEERNRICREILYLHEVADPSFIEAVSDPSSTSHITRSAPSLLVSPNPCHGTATVRLSGPSSSVLRSSLAVYDVSGRLLLKSTVRSSSFSLRTSSLPPGIYLLRFSSGDNCESARLVVD